MGVAASVNMGLTIVEDVTPAGDGVAAASEVQHDQYNTNKQLNGTSVPAIDAANSEEFTLSSGATIDLTALTGGANGDVDLTDKKVQAVKFKAPSTNSGNITITTGASNGHDVMPDGSWLLCLPPGAEVEIYIPEGNEDVDSTHKTWDCAGTDADVIQVALVGG